MNIDLNAISIFCMVADERNFRAAADRLGVTRSAISQTIRKLEETMGIALVQRTTRSVSLTEAGQKLYAEVSPSIANLVQAAQAASSLSQTARGQLRLAVSSIAERFLSGPLLAGFAEAHPQVQLDITVTDEEFDIVAEHYDAGVRLGELIEQDMIAVPVSSEQRQLAVCSPDYAARFALLSHPRDLIRHKCIGWRPRPGAAPYRWEFAENGREFAVAVEPELTTNDMQLMTKLACAGAGITFGMEETFAPYLANGQLVAMLEEFSPTFAGFYLYYPNRRNLAPKLRAFIDHVRLPRGR
ncbi:LysR family transcriptional regulator [Rhizobium sp. RM]|uniref:LysR family transcriptional regulator n=1 Tax=Rhizobium sp. RM TaxID=2748079 RepID=UPI00110D2919|nr:LysR family transcriptional regulator [Rhizobium sp. RM]NWJ25140.1 LysR family transcriptional regulator [Rhizobium sp. RM]TMV16905.1 LysR family transcriptional regulator [Rhizobium sp. Td3]